VGTLSAPDCHCLDHDRAIWIVGARLDVTGWLWKTVRPRRVWAPIEVRDWMLCKTVPSLRDLVPFLGPTPDLRPGLMNGVAGATRARRFGRTLVLIGLSRGLVHRSYVIRQHEDEGAGACCCGAGEDSAAEDFYWGVVGE
jgi:hypothetical protein